MLDLSQILAIFAASLAGSVHCVGMCGGLMLSATGTQLRNQTIYHLFRFLGYLSVGAVAGYLGKELFEWRWLPAQIIVSLAFVALVLSKLPSVISGYGMKLGFQLGKNKAPIRAAMIGFFTVFLPCGWLYSFVLLAMATHRLSSGMIILTVFWLGTLPALMFSRVLLQTAFARLGVSGKRVVSAIMVVAALLSVVEHWKSSFSADIKAETASCHSP